MSIRRGLLSLLQQAPMYGYQLRAEFERRTRSTWPLNIGQVYTTLARLERDGLVEATGSDDEGHVYYSLTESGAREVREWFATPVPRDQPPRDELAIKLALAVTVPGVDVRQVVQAQRTDTLRAMQEFSRLRARSPGDDLAGSLVLESLIFQAEAELRWLDHCEASFVRHERGDTRGRSAAGARRDSRARQGNHRGSSPRGQ